MQTDAMSIWIMIVLSGIVTFLIRFALIQLMGSNLNDRTKELLSFIPPAVLSALVCYSLFDNGIRSVALNNPKLWAAAVALMAALRFKNVIITILMGISCLWIFNYLLM